jgi:hypothetical protein
MTEDIDELKRKLKEGTDSYRIATDSDKKHLLGADVREFERRV